MLLQLNNQKKNREIYTGHGIKRHCQINYTSSGGHASIIIRFVFANHFQTIADKFHVTSDGLATTASYDTPSDFYQHFGPDVVPDYRTPTEASTPEVLHPSTGFVNGDRFNLPSVGHPTVGDPMAGSFKSGK